MARRTAGVSRFLGLSTVAVAAAGLALAGCVTPTGPVTPTTTTTAPPIGQPCSSNTPNLVCTQFPVGSLTRKIYAHVSSQPTPAAGRPVVLFFHGDGGTGNANLPSLYAQTDPDGALVVQLDGPNNIAGLNRGGTAWSFFMNGSTPDDVAFTKTVVDDVVNGSLVPGTAIDAHRIYAMGASRGGFMIDTLLIDARTAGTFAAGVNVSGNFYCETGDAVCSARIGGAHFPLTAPLLHIHGDVDTVVDPPARIPNPATATISWPWVLAQLADAYGCSGDFAYHATGSMGGRATYLYEPAGTCAHDDELLLVQGGGHVPSGWETPGWTYLRAKTRA
jgi:poly(3-hydroxybutyrate) depolymerase